MPLILARTVNISRQTLHGTVYKESRRSQHGIKRTAEQEVSFKWKLECRVTLFQMTPDKVPGSAQREFWRNLWPCKLPAVMDLDAKIDRKIMRTWNENKTRLGHWV